MGDKDLPDQFETNENIYSDEGREELEKSDAIDELEEGFMQGYEQGEKMVECGQCGKMLVDDDFVEEEFSGDVVRFCSKLCAMRYEEKQG